MKQSRGPLPISVLIVCGFLLIATVSTAYSLYDVIFPDHSVDWKYGLEVQMRLFWLGILTILMLWGTSRFVRALKEKSKGWR